MMVGRGLRLHPGKERLNLIDCVGVTGKANLCTAPSLLGIDVQNVPKSKIIYAGVQLLVSLIDGLTQTIPKLIPIAIGAAILLMETLLNNLDLLIDAGVKLVLAVSLGLIDALPKLVDKIPTIIEKLVLAIMDNLPQILDAGAKIIVALAGSLITNIPVLLGKIPQILDSLRDGFNIMIARIKDIGGDLVTGLWNGIKDQTDWLIGRIKNFAGDVLGSIKRFFGISSPSKETRAFGGFISEGLALGISDGAKGVLSTVNRLTADTMSAFGKLDLSATAGINAESLQRSVPTPSENSGQSTVMAGSNTTINLNGSYSFRDREDMDYLLNRLELAVRRA